MSRGQLELESQIGKSEKEEGKELQQTIEVSFHF